jgi:coenzyme F420 hydrogenase subunit beta
MYRGEGWPGKLKIVTKEGLPQFFQMNEWLSFAYYPQFVTVRCAMCYDISNQLSDISFGDAWGIGNDHVGSSVAIARTSLGKLVLERSAERHVVILKEVTPEQVCRGQVLDAKIRRTLIRAFLWRKIFRKPTPTVPSLRNKVTLKEWSSNGMYCLLLYLSQTPIIRKILLHLTPYMSKIIKNKW